MKKLLVAVILGLSACAPGTLSGPAGFNGNVYLVTPAPENIGPLVNTTFSGSNPPQPSYNFGFASPVPSPAPLNFHCLPGWTVGPLPDYPGKIGCLPPKATPTP